MWEPEYNGYTRLTTTTVWSLCICRGESLARIQHQACVRGGGQMAILLSLLYGGGGEVWKPDGYWYIRLTTTLWIEVCIRNSSCYRSLSLWNVLRV